MKLEELLESLEKAAEVKAPAASADDKPQISKELDALLTKEAAAVSAKQAFEDGEKLAHSILETLATQAVSEATKEAETKTDATTKADATPAGEKVAEVKAATATATKEVEKKAETKVETKETKEEDMNKQATDAGKELAKAILEKLATSQGPSSENTGPSGPHKIQQDQAKSVAQDDAKVGPTPGRNGTFNQLFDAIVAKAKSVSGATGYDQMATGPASGAEAKDQALGTPAIPPSPDINDHAKVAEEKQAAVTFLIEHGATWDQAVDLVKQASDEIEAEEMTQIKIAAVNELMESGVDFDTAVDSVRTAVQEVTAPEGK